MRMPLSLHPPAYLTVGTLGASIANNTAIPVAYFTHPFYGYYYHMALTCHTDLPACCRASDTGTVDVGAWLYPDGTEVTDSGHNFYSVRQAQEIELYHYSYATPRPGLYCCVIPTSVGEQRVCAYLTGELLLTLPAITIALL